VGELIHVLFIYVELPGPLNRYLWIARQITN